MERISLAELCSAISLFTDLGTGQQADHAMQTTLTAMRLADILDVGAETRSELYYTSLLRFLGCTADAAATASNVAGDETDFYAAMAPVSMGSPAEQLRVMARAVGPDARATTRVRRLLAMMTDRNGAEHALLPHCEVGERLARRMDLPEGVPTALAAAYAYWDGTGVPAGLSGEDIPEPMRIAIVARDIVLWSDDDADTGRVLMKRRGKSLDPNVVDAALAHLGELTAPPSGDLWDETVEAEPRPRRMLTSDTLDDALVALADFADLKIPHSAGHSRGVAALAAQAARLSGLADDQTHEVHRAALVHDLGRVGVGNKIWSHPGPLTAGQWERVRLHPYYSERILRRIAGLETIADLTGCHHERADGSGYHRGTRGDALRAPAQILAAADAYQAMTQPRPHRPALPHDEITAALHSDIESGRLAHVHVNAVLAAATGNAGPLETPRPANLTEREVDVLRLITRGHTNKQTAKALGISPKTVGTHIEHIYTKAGVTTRATATLFAIEHDLLD